MSATLLTMVADSADARRRSSLAALPGTSKSKPIVDVQLKNLQSNTFVPSFTTLEKIEGVATVTCPVDVAFDSLHVTFQGNAKTYVEKLATSAPTNPKRAAFHTFLRLAQPLRDEDLPEDHILKANVVYTFPFTFVVPERLLPQACTHRTDNAMVQDAHLTLPPSLGDPMMAGDGKSLLDDMTPDNARVSYGLRVFALRKVEGQSRPKMLFDSIKKVRIIPAVPEAPPLQIVDDREDDYVLSSSRTLKKGVFKGKLGTLTASAAQPPPFYLRSPNCTDATPVSAMTKVNVRFEPAEESSKPPRLGSLICRLKVATFYAAIPFESIPSRSQAFQLDSNRGTYVDTVSLSHRCVMSVQWTKHEPSERRDSVISKAPSASSTSEASDKDKKKPKKSKKETQDPATLPFYTASILLPLSLPSNKSFVPTFHSCLLSRIYLLDLVLSVNPSAASATSISVSANNLHLKVPIQIAAHGNANATPVISEDEAASIARREADGFFMPRTISPPESTPGTPPLELSRGMRGSIFTPRWGSISGPESGADSGGEGPLPPRYTGYVRSGIVMG